MLLVRASTPKFSGISELSPALACCSGFCMPKVRPTVCENTPTWPAVTCWPNKVCNMAVRFVASPFWIWKTLICDSAAGILSSCSIKRRDQSHALRGRLDDQRVRVVVGRDGHIGEQSRLDDLVAGLVDAHNLDAPRHGGLLCSGLAAAELLGPAGSHLGSRSRLALRLLHGQRALQDRLHGGSDGVLQGKDADFDFRWRVLSTSSSSSSLATSSRSRGLACTISELLR